MKSKLTHLSSQAAVAAILFTSAFSAQAVDHFWTAGTNTFNNPANWAPATIPGPNDNAIITNGGTVLINAADPAWTTFDIRAGQGGGDGAYIQNGQTVTLNAWFRLGVDAGTTGTYTMLSGTLNT